MAKKILKKIAYVNKLKSLCPANIHANADDSITLVCAYKCKRVKGVISFVFTRPTDFAEDSLKGDAKFLTKCIGNFELECKRIEMNMEIFNLEEDFE